MDIKLLRGLSIGLIVALFLSLLFIIGFFSTWQTFLADALYQEKEPLENIIILGIDDQSIQEIGRWPWPREVFVDLFSKLDNASVVGVDVAFFEDYNKEVDEQIAYTINKSNAKFILPVEYIKFEKSKGTEILETISPIKESADSLGFVNLFTETDGVTRYSPLGISGEGVDSYNSLSLEVYKAYLKRDLAYPENKFIINFVGKPNSFQTYSIADFINNRISIDLTNKIVFVGATSPDLHDDYFVPTSYGKAMPGVEVHTNALQTMITKRFLFEQSQISVIIVIFLICLALGILFSRIRMLLASILALVFIAVYFLTAIFAFNQGTILNMIYPFISITVVYGSTVLMNYTIEKKGRKKVTDTFGRYLSKEVVDEILKAKKIDLKGQEKEITILFTDIRGFTALSEKLSPHEVVAMLNSYLGGMTESVLKYKGVLDKYIGDCIMAVYNSPLRQEDHKLNAIKTALDMQKVVARISKTKNVPKVQCGVGINTGKAVVGNIGSEKRMDYTAIGDSVNLASRLCSVAKGGQIIIPEHLYKELKDKIKARKIGHVKLKGKEKEVLIYEVKGLK